jgi:hypothetical protein
MPSQRSNRFMPAGKQFARAIWPYLFAAVVIAFGLTIATQHSDAHVPVTSKYDYNRDVFPLVRDHCGSCHVAGGSAPMSLMTYKDAMPWAQSIRDELTAGRMPPWPVDPTSPAMKGGAPIDSRDLDVIVVWASGGTPESYSDAKVPDVKFHPQWKLGSPDLKIAMDADHTVAANAMEGVSDFSLPANVTGTKWIRAADLMPGNASIVRDAVISIENGPVLALWQPGGGTIAAPIGAAFRLMPGSKIHLQIHYKKHFDQEQSAVSDKSTVGLYFTDAPASGREMESFAIDAPKAGGDASGSAKFGGTVPKSGRIIALRPMLDRAYEAVNVDAVTPSGKQVPLLRLHGPRPQWFQRYWLQEPVELAAGTKIAVSVTPLADYEDEPKVTRVFPLQVVLDYIPL